VSESESRNQLAIDEKKCQFEGALDDEVYTHTQERDESTLETHSIVVVVVDVEEKEKKG
jgi:hypothetical protein